MLELYKWIHTSEIAGIYAISFEILNKKYVEFKVTINRLIQLTTNKNFIHSLLLLLFVIWTTAKNATIKKI